ncbi:hypothetical protein DFH06DRAFT_1478505 [Mycena polygramma]|nr:hypothetical protein DFH06DRAFT_1478505 [Mycena polygramma]
MTQYIIPGGTGDYDRSGLPHGLFALAAAGVERALKLYTATGVRDAVLPQFKRSTVGTAVAGYGKNIDRFKRSRWESLLAATGASTDGEPANRAVAIDDSLRDTMYVPSSSPPRE